jgi:hypothetical protein
MARALPYGSLVRVPELPSVTPIHAYNRKRLVYKVNEPAGQNISIGSIADLLSATGATVGSFVINKISAYGEGNGGLGVICTFVYTPTNESWNFECNPGAKTAKFGYIPPIVSAGPFSVTQSGLVICSTINVQFITFDLSYITVPKPAIEPRSPFEDLPPSPVPSVVNSRDFNRALRVRK